MRRPPIKAGKILYHANPCDGAVAASQACGAGNKLGPRYFSCAAGMGCNKAHSLLEILYHPVGCGMML